MQVALHQEQQGLLSHLLLLLHEHITNKQM